MTKISLATLVGSVADADSIPVFDGTAVSKRCTALQLAEYQDARRRRGARVRISSTFNVTTSTWTEIDWDSNDNFDHGDYWDSGDPAKFIVPDGEDGEYHLALSLQWPGMAVSGKFASGRILVGGTVLDTFTSEWLNSASVQTSLAFSSIVALSGGDEVTAEAWHDTGSTRALQTTYTNFEIFMLGKA